MKEVKKISDHSIRKIVRQSNNRPGEGVVLDRIVMGV